MKEGTPAWERYTETARAMRVECRVLEEMVGIISECWGCAPEVSLTERESEFDDHPGYYVISFYRNSVGADPYAEIVINKEV